MPNNPHPSGTHDLLRLFLGRAAADAVARGDLQRGQSLDVTAAIMLLDLRGSTPLIQSMEISAYIRLLNDIFDHIAPHITDRGGEILQFTGDGLLAVFRETDDACRQKIVCPVAVMSAFRASTLADAALRQNTNGAKVGFGLSYGVVAYGNVGAESRQSFTVISSEVSRADRLQRLCPIEGHNIALSDTFANALPPGTARSIGSHSLKGFETETEVFVPAQ